MTQCKKDAGARIHCGDAGPARGCTRRAEKAGHPDRGEIRMPDAKPGLSNAPAQPRGDLAASYL
jgi:hypothetical protein